MRARLGGRDIREAPLPSQACGGKTLGSLSSGSKAPKTSSNRRSRMPMRAYRSLPTAAGRIREAAAAISIPAAATAAAAAAHAYLH